MTIYIVFFTLLLIAAIWEVFFAKRSKLCEKKIKFLYFIFSFSLLVLAAFRDGVGLDYYSYQGNYNDIKLHGLLSDEQATMEPFFILLNYISPSFRFLIIVSAGMCVLTKVVFYKDFRYRLLCLFLYFCSVFLYYDMGILRQGIAIGLVWLSFRYIERKKPLNFLLLVFVATMFHVTSLAVLPIYLLGDKRLKTKLYICVLIIGCVGYVIMLNINSIAKAINIPYISYKIIAYTENIENSGNLFFPLLKRVLFLIVFTYVMRIKVFGMKNGERSSWLYYNAFYLGIVELIAFLPLNIMATRGTASLYFTFIPLFSNALSRVKRTDVKIIIMCIALFAAVDNFMSVLFESSGGTYIPYRIGI